MVCTRAAAINLLDAPLVWWLVRKALEDSLGHCRPANVAKADEEDGDGLTFGRHGVDLMRRCLALVEGRGIRKLRIDDRLRRFVVDQERARAGAPGKVQKSQEKEAEPLSCPHSKVPRDDALGSSVQP